MGENKILLETKQIIRSLLISCPSKITVGQLCSDYRELNGKILPYVELGYKTAQDFIKTMPDVAHMDWMPSANQFMLSAVADKTTKHIEQLVQKQKNSRKSGKKKRNVVFRPQAPSKTSSSLSNVNNLIKSKSVSKVTKQKPVPKTSNSFQQKPVPKTLKVIQQKPVPKTSKVIQQKPIVNSVLKVAQPKTVVKVIKQKEIEAANTPSFCDNIKKTVRRELSALIPMKVKNQIIELLHLRGSLYVEKFLIAFKEYFRNDFPVESLGFCTLTECLMCLPDIVCLESVGFSYLVKLNQSAHVNKTSESLLHTLLSEKFQDECSSKLAANNFEFRTDKNTTGRFNTQENINVNTISSLKFSDILNLKTVDDTHLKNLEEEKNRIQNKLSLGNLDNSTTFENNLKLFHSNDSNNQDHMNKNDKELSCNYNLKITDWKVNQENLEVIKKCMDSSIKKPKLSYDTDNRIVKANKLDNFYQKQFKSQNTIPNDIKKEFQQVLSSHPSGILASKFLSEYFKITGKCFRLSEYGFCDIIELVISSPEIFKINSFQFEKNDCLLFTCVEYKPDDDNDKLNESCQLYATDSFIDNSLKANIINLIKHFKKISLDHFEKIYKSSYQTELPWAKLDYDSIESFMLDLSNVVPIKLSFEESTLFASLYSEDYHCVKPVKSDLSKLTSEIIQDFVIPGERYKIQHIPENLTNFIPVFVSDIDNLDQFWIQLKGKITSKSLEVLMKNLQIIYNNKENDKYQMPDNFIAEHNVCAALWPFNNRWHRGIITKVSHTDQVEVLYVDYGTKCRIPNKFLRLLKREFLRMPSQALKVRLACIQPVNGIQWDEKAKIRFSELCMGKEFIAVITNINFNDRLSVYLCSISDNRIININDILIDEKLALASHVQINSIEQYLEKKNLNSNYITKNFKNNDISDETFDNDELYRLCDAKKEFDFSIIELFLTENNNIHVIVLNQKLFISSGDIASLFQKSEGLEKVLIAKKALIPYIVLEKSDNERLFTELVKNKVKGINNSIVIYPVESIIDILICLKHPSKSLVSEIENKIKELKNKTDITDISSLKERIIYENEKRKNIIRKMLDTGVLEEYVEEIKHIENNIYLFTCILATKAD